MTMKILSIEGRYTKYTPIAQFHTQLDFVVIKVDSRFVLKSYYFICMEIH